MDKISMQITVNAITSPELLQYLTAIESPKHRSEVLRRLAEIGLGVMRAPAAAPFQGGRQPVTQAAPAYSGLPANEAVDRTEPRPTVPPELPAEPLAPGSAAPACVLAAETVPAVPAPSTAAVAMDATAGATPPPFALDLNSAMDRFF